MTDVETRKPEGAPPKDLIAVDDLRIERGRGKETFVVEVPRLRIARGSFTSILGPSGCGKTSLLLVLGLLRGGDDDEEFAIRCRQLTFRLAAPLPGFRERSLTIYEGSQGGDGRRRLPAEQIEDLRQKMIGFCLQGGELVPSLALGENVAVPAHLCRFPDPGARARRSLAALEMSEHLEKLPSELSGGQSQRGVLARSLVHDPPLVILDEPTSSLDRGTAEGALDLLRERARERGQTVVTVTHDRALAERFSDHVIEMDVIGRRRGGIVGSRSSGREVAGAPAEPIPTGAATEAGLGRYYLRLALLDALGPLATLGGRLLRRRRRGPAGAASRWRRSSTWAFAGQLVKNALIAVAIGLLILLLRGIRSGLVEEFRHNLVRSPTARELVITPLAATGALTGSRLEALAAEHPEIDLIIPQSTQVVSWADPPTDQTGLTLAGTLPQDPKLAVVYADQDFSDFDARALIISSALAVELKAEVGSEVSVWVTRDLDADGRRRESMPATLRVSNVLPGGDKKKAYAHLELMGQLEDFKAGRPVPEHGWPGFASPVPPRYAAYLLFAKRPLSAREERILKSRGLRAELLDGDDPRAALYGMRKAATALGAEAKPEILAYAVRSGRQEEDLRWLDSGIGEVGKLLIDSDGIMLPWNEPLPATVDGTQVTLVGLSGSTRWLKGYLRHRRAVFPRREPGWQLAFGDRGHETRPAVLEVDLDGERPAIRIEQHGEPEPTEEEPVAVVPATLLAHLHMAAAGLAVADSEQRIFRSTREERTCYQARVFVRDIFQVAELHRRLAGTFAVRSHQARVREVQHYSQVLDLLVRILSVMALVIAFFSVYVVFHEISTSKKRMIGTLRIMGLPQRGVVILLLVRGLLVAAVACALILILGELLSRALNALHGGTLSILGMADFLQVMLWIVIVCSVAVLPPAWKVSKIDPVLALEEAKLNA